MSNDKKPPLPKGRPSIDKISDFLNLPGEPEDLIPAPKAAPAPVENALVDPTENEYDNDLRFSKDIQRDLLSKGMEMIDNAIEIAKSTGDPDAHEVVVKYIKELTKANHGLLDLNRKHQGTQEAKARIKKINKEIVSRVTETTTDEISEEVSQKYTIKTTSSEMLRMVRELEAEEAKKKATKKK